MSDSIESLFTGSRKSKKHHSGGRSDTRYVPQFTLERAPSSPSARGHAK